MSEAEKVRRTAEEGFILAEVDGEGMMINVEAGTSYFLNETALIITRLLNEGRNIEEIKSSLLEQYDVGEEEAEKDIREFADRLEKKMAR